MIKTTILAVTILFLGTMMVQEVYAGGTVDDIKGLMRPGDTGSGTTFGVAIPDWVRNNFEWYINDQIDEKTLLTSMNWMFDNNIMHLSEKAAQEVQGMRNEINDLKQELEVTKAAIAIPNLIEARKGANESSDTGSSDFLRSDLASKGIVVVDSIPSDLAAKGIIVIGTMPDQRATGSSLRDELEARGIIIIENMPGDLEAKGIIIINTMPSDSLRSDLAAKGIIIINNMPSDVAEKGIIIVNGNPSDLAAKGIIIIGTTPTDSEVELKNLSTRVDIRDFAQDNLDQFYPDTSTGSSDRPTEEIAFYYNKISFATDAVDDIMAKGGTTSAWEDGLATFSDMGYKYLPPTTTGVSIDKALLGESLEVGLGMHAMNIVIEKESQIIDAELKIVEQWLDIIAEKQAITSTTTSDRLATAPTEEYTVNYYESDLNFISRILESSDQKIKSLQTGVTVLEQKLQTVGDDGQLANIDLQNSLQKMQQTLQMMSNLSKLQHDTAMSIIRNMSG